MKSYLEREANKPIVFLSHDSKDKEVAGLLSSIFQELTAHGIKVFFTSGKSSRPSVDFGADWFAESIEHLEKASVFLCLLTRNSLNRPWILFEAGFAQARKKDCCAVALLVGLKQADILGHPLDRYQHVSAQSDNLDTFIDNVCNRLGFDPGMERIRAETQKFTSLISQNNQARMSDHEISLIAAYRKILAHSLTTMAYLGLLDARDSASNDQIANHVKEAHGFVPDRAHSQHIMYSLAKAGWVKPGRNVEITKHGRLCYDNIMHRDENPKPVDGEVAGLRALVSSMRFYKTIVVALGTDGDMSRNVLEGIIRQGAFDIHPDFVKSAFSNAIHKLSAAGVVDYDGPTRVRLTAIGKLLFEDLSIDGEEN